jgi:hypothetical protein
MKKIITLSLLFVFIASCKTAAPTIGGEGTFEILKQETNGGREKAANVLIKSQEDLDKLYAELNLTDVPKVDFVGNNVVALFMGQKNTGGFSISVGKVTLEGETNTATVQIVESTPQDMATMALTAPYCIATISKSKKVEFVKSPYIAED